MKFPASHFTFTLSLIAAAALTLTACGGGSGGSDDDGAVTAITTVTPIVMDGLISNAIVCWDANDNGTCDSTETQGTTDSTGKATLFIPTASVATAKLLAVVTAGVSSDADTGLVATSYTLRATAGKHAVISPLTDMTQAKIAADSTQTFEKAQAAVLSELGLSSSISVTDNFIAKRDTDSNYKDAGVKARTLVLIKQAGAKTATTLNCPVVSTETIKDDVQLSKTLSTELESIKSKLDTDDSVRLACSSTASISSDCDTALKTKATAVVASCTTAASTTSTSTSTAATSTATTSTTAAASTPATSTPTTSTAATSTPATSTSTTTTTSTTPTTSTTTTPASTTPTATVTSAVNGKALYGANTCAACHGMPPSSNKVLKGANNPSSILSAINSNAGGMGMYIGKFTTQELTDMAAYLATPGI